MPNSNRRAFIEGMGAGLLMLKATTSEAQNAAKRPNIILVITDDQGYGDLARHGHPILQTPHLDRLHDESVRLDNFLVSPTCSPTRASLMTGRHEFKNGVTHTINERERLSLNATTIAQVLQKAGYQTGIFGKWHLGDEDAYQPQRRGFEEVFIHGAGGIGQSYEGSCGDAPGNLYFDPAIWHNDKFVKTHGYCTDIFFDEAISWMSGAKNKAPFFAYIATNAPHEPLQVPQSYEALYKDKAPADVAKFLGMITNIDDNIGKLRAALQNMGIERDTLLIFLNDNGSATGAKFYNAGMRAQKGTPYLGGIRAMNFWHWPGTFAPRTVNELTAHLDFFPTLASLAGAPSPDNLDGFNLLPLLKNQKTAWPARMVFTHLGRWKKGEAAQSKYEKCAVRWDKWHMVRQSEAKGWELYDVSQDIGEKNDLVSKEHEVMKKLDAAYDKWWQEVLPLMVNENAVGPKVNPFKERFWKQFGAGKTAADI